MWFKPKSLKIKLPNKNDKQRDRCVYYLSKTTERPSSVNDVIHRNVNILNKNGNIIWTGNINITTKFENIYDLSKEIGTIYICSKDEKNYKNNSLLKI